MTNYEKYKDEILKYGPSRFGLKNGNIVACCDITCSDCCFSVNPSCDSSILDWLFEECREKPVLTKQEHMICELLEDGYLTKIKNKFGTNLYYSKIKLLDEKKTINFLSEDGPFAVITSFCDLIGAGFDFIEPNSYYAVKDLLGCAWVFD